MCWFSHGQLKISKHSISFAQLGKCSKSKFTPLNSAFLHCNTCVFEIKSDRFINIEKIIIISSSLHWQLIWSKAYGIYFQQAVLREINTKILV